MASKAMAVDGMRLHAEMRMLATFTQCEQTGRDGETAVTRVVFSENDMAARRWLKTLFAEAGLEVREDAVGNTFARWPGTEPTLAAVGTGSHTDAIPHAGMYDGTLGVLGGLEAIRSLQRAGLRLRRSVELVLFTSEEPTRFGIGCLGSRLMAGTLDPERADGLRDSEERSLAEVRAGAGFHGDLASVRQAPGVYSAWVELHIEQGPLLERDGVDIGVVSAIAAPASYRIRMDGVGGHAGALLMPDRRDALCAAAEWILAVEAAALGTGAVDTVATVGTVAVHPGAVNSVPSRVDLQLDVRDIDPARRDTVVSAVRAAGAGLQQRRGIVFTMDEVNADLPATCDGAVMDAVEAACRRNNLTHRQMVSRAYHDSLFMARLGPAGMIFVPCRGGVSHRPDEFATVEAMTHGVQVLAETLAQLAG